MFSFYRNSSGFQRAAINFRLLPSLLHKYKTYNCNNNHNFLTTVIAKKSTKATPVAAVAAGAVTTAAHRLHICCWAFADTVTAISVNQRNFSSDSKQGKGNKKNTNEEAAAAENMENKSEKLNVNKDELKKRLTPLQYQVTQEAATERPFTGCYNKHYEKGIYQCIVCHQDLFSSDTKYDAGCGWPAFNDVLDKGKVTLHRDASIPERIRTEVRCARCNAHMGHVFEDGPKPTRKRYCINSASIEFITADELNSRGGSAAAAPCMTATPTPIAQQ